MIEPRAGGAIAALLVAIALGDVVAASAPGGAWPPEMTLTAAAPERDLPLPPFSHLPRALRLGVARVDNPALQSVAIEVSLRWRGPDATAGATSEHRIGTVALYPSDQPGSFRITLPEEARALLARRGEGELRVRIQSPVAGRALAAPLRILLDPPAWR